MGKKLSGRNAEASFERDGKRKRVIVSTLIRDAHDLVGFLSEEMCRLLHPQACQVVHGRDPVTPIADTIQVFRRIPRNPRQLQKTPFARDVARYGTPEHLQARFMQYLLPTFFVVDNPL